MIICSQDEWHQGYNDKRAALRTHRFARGLLQVKTENINFEGLPCGIHLFVFFLALGRICVRIVFLSILRALLGGLSGSPGVLFIEITLYKSDLWKQRYIFRNIYQTCMNIYETCIYHS